MIYFMTHFGMSPSDLTLFQHSASAFAGAVSTVIRARIDAGKITESDKWRRRMSVMV